MNRDRLGIVFGVVLTILYAGAMAASLGGAESQLRWAERINPDALHVLGGGFVLAVILNLVRGENAKP